jgi:hypothetical protein
VTAIVTRTDWLDWFVDRSGESAVLLSDEVVVLSPLATVLVGEVADGVSLRALGAALEREFGSPPSGDLLTTTRDAVDALVDSGVLAVSAGWAA